MKTFNLSDIDLTKYLFFTGKGGVGKTSITPPFPVKKRYFVKFISDKLNVFIFINN